MVKNDLLFCLLEKSLDCIRGMECLKPYKQMAI